MHRAGQNQKNIHMDKKSKKRIDVLRSNLQRLRQQLAGAQKQIDDREETQTLVKQIAAVESELQSLTGTSSENKRG